MAADNEGAPLPKNTPKFDVLLNLKPVPAVPPAGMDVPPAAVTAVVVMMPAPLPTLTLVAACGLAAYGIWSVL